MTSKADRGCIRQRDKARKDKRLIALGQLVEAMGMRKLAVGLALKR